MRSPTETRWRWGFAAFAALLTTLPYLLAFARAGEDWVFTGFLFAVDDGNSYIAKMLSGAHGAWTFRTPYSNFPQRGLFVVYLNYLLLGKLAGGEEVHLQLIVLYHLFRIAGTVVYVLAVYDFLSIFIQRPELRRLGTVLAAFGGGLGWLLLAIGQGSLFGDLPLDFYSPEAFGFLEVFGLPHLAVSRALTLWGFVALLRNAGSPTIRRGASAGLLWFAAGLFNPLAPAIALLLAGIYLLALLVQPAEEPRAATFRMYNAAALVGLPPILYTAAASVLDPFFKAWSAQNTITSPHPIHYLLAFGIYLPWAVRGGRRLIASGAIRNRLPVIWVLVVPLLVYLPITLQRRLTEGVFIALIVLLLAGLNGERTGSRLGVEPVGIVFTGVLTTFVLYAGAVMTAWSPGEPAFRTSAEVAAFEAFSDSAEPGAVVLAPVQAGNALPAFTPIRVAIGHGPETIGFEALRPSVEAFFDGRLSGAAAAALLSEQEVDFVFWPGAKPPPYPGLELYFSNEAAAIYSVMP